jgi:hypothetical protein
MTHHLDGPICLAGMVQRWWLLGEHRTIERKSRSSNTLFPSRQQWRKYLTARGHIEAYQKNTYGH